MSVPGVQVSRWDRFLMSVAPDWGLRRIRARATAQVMSRYYEAAQIGRRTTGWQRVAGDVNAANAAALPALRELSRDLRRNNGWAKRGLQAIVNNTVGWGIQPKPNNRSRARSEAALKLWNAWADTTRCDFDGRLNFYGLQRLAMETICESGEVLIVKHPAATKDRLSIPMRIQVLEPEFIDTGRMAAVGTSEQIVDGVEFDLQGRRVAYWMFAKHPGAQRLTTKGYDSIRIPADRVLHVYRVDRPGQVRGVPWLSSAITRLKDLDDFEDAELMQQKVAACFGAFVTDMDGAGSSIGGQDADDDMIEHLEPGHIAYLPPGKTVTFAQPPRAQDSAFSTRTLRRIAVSLGVPFEELSGDYSQVNFSSARMSRLSHWQNVHEWRWHMLIPQLCDGVWSWAMDLACAMEGWPDTPIAQWAPPPMPILEPDKEGLAYQRLIRIGAMTWPQVIRELGEDPKTQLDEIEAFNKDIDARGIVFDSDPRRTTQAGQVQMLSAPPVAEDNEADDDESIDVDVDDETTEQPAH